MTINLTKIKRRAVKNNAFLGNQGKLSFSQRKENNDTVETIFIEFKKKPPKALHSGIKKYFKVKVTKSCLFLTTIINF